MELEHILWTLDSVGMIRFVFMLVLELILVEANTAVSSLHTYNESHEFSLWSSLPHPPKITFPMSSTFYHPINNYLSSTRVDFSFALLNWGWSGEWRKKISFNTKQFITSEKIKKIDTLRKEIFWLVIGKALLLSYGLPLSPRLIRSSSSYCVSEVFVAVGGRREWQVIIAFYHLRNYFVMNKKKKVRIDFLSIRGLDEGKVAIIEPKAPSMSVVFLFILEVILEVIT